MFVGDLKEKIEVKQIQSCWEGRDSNMKNGQHSREGVLEAMQAL